MTTALLRLPEVIQRTGYSRSSLWRLIRIGQFPAPIKLGARAVGWRDDLIQHWIEARIAAAERHTT
jgi:prophage regulatory protein